MAGIKIVDLPPLGRDLASTDLLELSLAGGTGSRKITGQEIMNASKLSINNTPIINGTVGRVLFQGTGNVLQQSSSLFWDNAATSLNVIGTNPSVTLNSTSSLTNFSQGFGFSKNGVGIFSFGYTESVSAPRFFIYAATTDRDAIKIYNSTANVAIGNTPSQNTDAGYRLDVNGTFRASDSLIASSSGGGAYKLTVQQTGTGQGNTFRVIQLGYSMIDVNTNGVGFMPFPSASGTVGITNWTSTGGQSTTFFTKNSEFTPQGGSQAIPLIKFPNVQSPIVMGATATVDLRGYLTVSGSFNATSGLGSGQRLLPTLTAIADNDVLVGLDINPVFTVNTSFVNTSTSLRINANYAPPSWSGNNNQYGIDISPTFRDSNVSIGLRINPNFINVSSGGAWALSIENTGYGAIRQTSTATPNIFAGVTSIGANTSGHTGFSLNVANAGIKVGTVNGTGQHLIITHSEGGATFSSIRSQFSSSSAQMLIDVASQGNLRLFGTGNVTINSATDAGFRLDVNGTARVVNNILSGNGTYFTTGSQSIASASTANAFMEISSGASSSGSLVWSKAGSLSTLWQLYSDTSNNIAFFRNGLNREIFKIFESTKNVGIDETSGSASFTDITSAKLFVNSTTKGFLPPRMTQAQRNAITSPAIGLEIYQTDATEGKYIYKSSGWTYIG